MSELKPLYAQFLREKQFLSGFSSTTIKLFGWTFNRWDALVGEFPTQSNVKEFVIKLNESGIKPVTINSYSRAFNSFLTWLFEEGHTPERLRIKKVREEQVAFKSFNDEHIKRFLSYQPKTFPQKRLYAMICVACDTGTRINELLTLKRADIDLDNLFFKVMGKGGKERYVPVSVECRKVLYRFLKSHDNPLAFPTEDGTQLSYRCALDQIKRVGKKLGITGARCSWHTFRHYYAIQHIKQGGDVFSLQRILGHSSLDVTKLYVKFQQEDLQLIHRKTSVLARLK